MTGLPGRRKKLLRKGSFLLPGPLIFFQTFPVTPQRPRREGGSPGISVSRSARNRNAGNGWKSRTRFAGTPMGKYGVVRIGTEWYGVCAVGFSRPPSRIFPFLPSYEAKAGCFMAEQLHIAKRSAEQCFIWQGAALPCFILFSAAVPGYCAGAPAGGGEVFSLPGASFSAAFFFT